MDGACLPRGTNQQSHTCVITAGFDRSRWARQGSGAGEGGAGHHVCTTRVYQAARLHVHKTHEMNHAACGAEWTQRAPLGTCRSLLALSAKYARPQPSSEPVSLLDAPASALASCCAFLRPGFGR